MKRCDRLVEVGRRGFLLGAGVSATALATAPLAKAEPAPRASALLVYPATWLANMADLKLNTPLPVVYPDAQAPGVLLKLGVAVQGGAGPGGDIVGFSTICPHAGFPLGYRSDSRTLQCPGHYAVFDIEQGGQQTFGHATQNLPQYALRIDAKGDIYAEGLDEMLYGRHSNVL